MRSARFAEVLLSLVASPDRAAAAAGDLVEDAGSRGTFWFWRSVARVTLALLGRDLASMPLMMTAGAAFGWFLYMALSLVLALVGYLVVTLLWGVAYVLAHHTGFELLATLLRVQLDWPPIPAFMTYAIQAVVLLALAPVQLGRFCAPHWRGHELALSVFLLLIWLSMSVLVPIVGVGIRVTPTMVPIAVAFFFVGLVSARFRPTPASS